MFDLNGKVAIVTGGNGGIGLGMAHGLARAGRAGGRGGAQCGEVGGGGRGPGGAGGDALALEVDVTDEASVDALFAQAAQRCGRLDILVNNAGINIRKPARSAGAGRMAQVLDTNLTSAFLCARAAYPHLKRHRRRQDHQYRLDAVDLRCVLRAGLWCQQRRRGAAHAGRRHRPGPATTFKSNAVLPGWIDTDLTQQARKDVPA